MIPTIRVNLSPRLVGKHPAMRTRFLDSLRAQLEEQYECHVELTEDPSIGDDVIAARGLDRWYRVTDGIADIIARTYQLVLDCESDIVRAAERRAGAALASALHGMARS